MPLAPLLLSLLAAEPSEKPAGLTPGGYVEAYYQWNFARPNDGVTAWRGFDNRSNTLTLSNVALEGRWVSEDVWGRLTLQFGSTPSSYYLAEPSHPGGLGVNASDLTLWKYLQQANAGFRLGKVKVNAGLFLAPIGPEGMAVKDNWNFSRSNLFFGLPFYETGISASLPFQEHWTVNLGVFNGWNSVVDNNTQKSVQALLSYERPEGTTAGFLIFSGVERNPGALEGAVVRTLFDVWTGVHATADLAFIFHLDGGFEPGALGVSHWQAAAVYGRYQLVEWLAIAARADLFLEHAPEGSAPLFFPANRVASQTLTVELRPHERVSVRVEARHDGASAPMFLEHGSGRAPVRRDQNTVTVGVTSWL